MKVAIVGSRDYPNERQVVDYVNTLPLDTVIISGTARGVDRWAEKAARARGMTVETFPAKWRLHGKRAGFLRNTDIVIAADKVVAFTIGSNGTADTIAKARQYGKPVEVYGPNGDFHQPSLLGVDRWHDLK